MFLSIGRFAFNRWIQIKLPTYEFFALLWFRNLPATESSSGLVGIGPVDSHAVVAQSLFDTNFTN
jgi:hypothetical protein